MKIKTKKGVLIGALIVVACVFASVNVQANWSGYEGLWMSSDSPLNPNPGTVMSNLVIMNPTICGPLTELGGYGNRPGHVEFEVASNYYGLIFVDAGYPFKEGVKYIDPAPWPYPEDGKATLLLSGLGRGYLALFPDSWFRFNDITTDPLTGGIVSCELEIHQHGVGWDPYYSEGWEHVLLNYNCPDTMVQKSLMAMVVPEPTPALFAVLAAGVIWFRCRNGTK